MAVNPYDSMSAAEVKEVKKRLNTETARRTRKKRRMRMDMLKQEYEANERRIEHLTKLASDLSRELNAGEAPTIEKAKGSGGRQNSKQQQKVAATATNAKHGQFDGPTF